MSQLEEHYKIANINTFRYETVFISYLHFGGPRAGDAFRVCRQLILDFCIYFPSSVSILSVFTPPSPHHDLARTFRQSAK